MKVKDLKKILSKLEDNMEVCLTDVDDNDSARPLAVVQVHYVVFDEDSKVNMKKELVKQVLLG